MKLNITYESLSKILDGKLTAEKPFSVLEKLSIDSRTLQKGEAYLVIKGQKHDGHKFIKAAIEKGVLCLTAKDKVRLLPPLNIPMEDLKKAVEIIKSCL